MKNSDKIRVTPLAFESLGVRSMCTFIETPEVKILVDPGATLGPRFSLLPHPSEYRALKVARQRIREAANKADVLTVSHYHNDHHTPNFVDTVWLGSSPEEAEAIYQDKIGLVKNIRSNINFSQRRRGWMFGKMCEKYLKELHQADGETFEYGATKLRFSPAVPHGTSESGLGWVLMLTIEREDETIMHTADVQGPMLSDTLDLILQAHPSLLIIGGPPLYLSGFKVEEQNLEYGITNLAKVVNKIPKTILEHHLLRSDDWRERSKVVLDQAEISGHQVLTAASFLGTRDNLLECKRRKLYEEEPPGGEFSKWLKLKREVQKKTPPPI